MDDFSEGYAFFEKNSGSYTAGEMGEHYVDQVDHEISVLIKDMNAFAGFKTDVKTLKGDIAEFWHSDTFNIDAAVKGSDSKTFVDRSHGFASADISSNFGRDFGLKYYNTAEDSAKQQAKSVFERFKEYQSHGGKDSLDEFLSKRGINNMGLNDPIYRGQIRVIPEEQREDVVDWLTEKISKESSTRPDQVARYQETRDMLSDKVEDGKGTQSVPLTKEEAERLAKLAKEGNVTHKTLKELGISTEDLIKYEYILKQAVRAGVTAATISMVLKTAPEIYKAIIYLLNNGEIDKKQFQEIGFAALQGGSEGFIRGSISASITAVCKAGLWGETLKNVRPEIVGAVTVIAMDTIKNAFKVAIHKMSSKELANEFVKEMVVSAASLLGGGIVQSFIGIPVLGFMLGSFVGSVVGSFAYNMGCNTALSFCIDTGFTMFGIVDQSYELPDEVIESIGAEVFRYEEFQFEEFKPEEFSFEEFEFEQFKFETFGIEPLRRGVIGVGKIGYI